MLLYHARSRRAVRGLGRAPVAGAGSGIAGQVRRRSERRARPAVAHEYNGNLRVSAQTSSRTSLATVASPTARSTRSINAAIADISAAPMPRVVTADAPMRMPLVTNGD